MPQGTVVSAEEVSRELLFESSNGAQAPLQPLVHIHEEVAP